MTRLTCRKNETDRGEEATRDNAGHHRDRSNHQRSPIMTTADITAVYLHIQDSLPLPETGGTTIARTAQITPTLLVDLGHDGRILGIENLTGPIGTTELITVLKALRVAQIEEQEPE